MRKIEFTKMHGAGNDYIYINAFKYPVENPERLAVKWSKPHTGIGSDGLVIIEPSNKADFGMRIFNADGSEAGMCGNASRCIGKYVYESGLTHKTEISLETRSGIKFLRLNVKNGIVETVTVDMGVPSEIKEIDLGSNFHFNNGTTVNMGNPHLVIFVDDISQIDLKTDGPALERHPLFPDRVNVEFAQIIKPGLIRMRVWERGSGITMACGTGACATAVAAISIGLCPNETDVEMDGGILHISWQGNGKHLYMTGKATKVFDGTIEINN